jgi:hypothetical protein
MANRGARKKGSRQPTVNRPSSRHDSDSIGIANEDAAARQINTTLQERKLELQAHLAEHSRLVGESHTAFQRQQTALTVMMVLATAVAGLILPRKEWFSQDDNFKYLVLLPLPFIILGFLHLRDDLKISEIDTYIWENLRPRVIALTGVSGTDVWGYLKRAEEMRYGWHDLFTYVYFVLSVARYSVPPFAIVCSFVLYFWSVSQTTVPWLHHWSFKIVIFELVTVLSIFSVSFGLLWKRGKYSGSSKSRKRPGRIRSMPNS